MGRDWESPTGNVYVSTIVRLKPADPPAPILAFLAAVAVQQTLALVAPGIAFQIKWPNDILSIDGAKISGMLLERSGDAVIVGIGVNLASHPEGLPRPVTSLAALGVVPPAPQIFVERLAAQFAALIDQWRLLGVGSILSLWRQYAHPVDTALSVHLPDGESLQGHYDALGDDGAMKLRLADGAIRAIHAADVFLV
jgi:BirA family transcriptional regulator, biotin operon repressor / biotin---[acetyl-CoA-carboxylase] ligase